MVGTKRIKISQVPSMEWNGKELLGAVSGRDIQVLVPARLVSFRVESFPVANERAIVAASRLRASRLFASLGSVQVDAIISPPSEDQVHVLLMALPQAIVSNILLQAQAELSRVLTSAAQVRNGPMRPSMLRWRSAV